jgi:protein-disulfide isomerase
MSEGTSHSHKNNSALLIPGSILLGAVIIGISLIIGLSHAGSATSAQVGGGTTPQQAVNVKDVKIAGEPYIGNANAPVTLAFWSDYQCPYCKAFEVGGIPQITIPAAMPDLVSTYVDTGKVKIVFKDFPFLGNDSITGAEYGRSIWHLYPTQYFAWRTAMYNAQDEEGDKGFGNAATIDQLIISKFPKMNDATIKADITANKAAYDAAMQADMQEGESFGITGTPGFITGQILLPGDEPFSTIAAAIDPQLK